MNKRKSSDKIRRSKPKFDFPSATDTAGSLLKKFLNLPTDARRYLAESEIESELLLSLIPAEIWDDADESFASIADTGSVRQYLHGQCGDIFSLVRSSSKERRPIPTSSFDHTHVFDEFVKFVDDDTAFVLPSGLPDFELGFFGDGRFPDVLPDPVPRKTSTILANYGAYTALGFRSRFAELIFNFYWTVYHGRTPIPESTPYVLRYALGYLTYLGGLVKDEATFLIHGRRCALPYLTSRSRGRSRAAPVWSIRLYWRGVRLSPHTRLVRGALSLSNLLSTVGIGMTPDITPGRVHSTLFLIALSLRVKRVKVVKDFVQRYIFLPSDDIPVPYVTGLSQVESKATNDWMLSSVAITTVDERKDLAVAELRKALISMFDLNRDVLDTVLEATEREQSFIEAILESFGYRRGSPFTTFKAANEVGFDPKEVKWDRLMDISRDHYLDYFRVGRLSEKIRGSLHRHLLEALTLPGILRATPTSTSAGSGSVQFAFFIDGDKITIDRPDARASAPASISELAALVPEIRGYANRAVAAGLLARDVVSTMFSSTKKGAFIMFYSTELSSLCSSGTVLTFLSLMHPGATGERAVPFKDPRLIFMVPLVVHIVLAAIAHPMTSAASNYPYIFVRSETGVPTKDHSRFILSTFGGGIQMSAHDWKQWDASLVLVNQCGFTRALREYFSPSVDPSAHNLFFVSILEDRSYTVLEFLIAVVSLTNSGIFLMRGYGPEMEMSTFWTNVRRLASGSALTSLDGSILNLARLTLMFRLMFEDLGVAYDDRVLQSITSDTYEVKVLALCDTLKKLEYPGLCRVLETVTRKASVSTFSYTIHLSVTMGDDISQQTESKTSPPSPGCSAVIHICMGLVFTSYANKVCGAMNPAKSIFGDNVTVFVRRMEKYGMILPRPSVSIVQRERGNVDGHLDDMKTIVSIASEIVVRGANLDALSMNVVLLFWLGYDRFPVDTNFSSWVTEARKAGAEVYESGRRWVMFYPLSNLVHPDSIGFNPLTPALPASSGAVMGLSLAVRSKSLPPGVQELAASLLELWDEPIFQPVDPYVPMKLGPGIDKGVRSFKAYLYAVNPHMADLKEDPTGRVPKSLHAVEYPRRLMAKQAHSLTTKQTFVRFVFPPASIKHYKHPNLSLLRERGPVPWETLFPVTRTELAHFVLQIVDPRVTDCVVAIMKQFQMQDYSNVVSLQSLVRGSVAPDGLKNYIRVIEDSRGIPSEQFMLDAFLRVTGLSPPADRLATATLQHLAVGLSESYAHLDSIIRMALPAIRTDPADFPQVLVNISVIMVSLARRDEILSP